ncbi:ammonium transporter [Stenoxybacter acetivorans]|uniref:ammonium transporter n=1 Tax=Stenoxybacter acetivorans TaxID=422441 RepID=UPI000569D149|nr:ammonium transporter [Stenoxybacter acetivorans]
MNTLAHLRKFSGVMLMLTASAQAFAEEAAPALDTGSTAWMIVAAALVVLMCMPGLAMFYAGMLRSKNVLSVFSQFLATAGVVAVLWVIFGYSIATDTTGMVEGEYTLHSFVGGLSAAFLTNITPDTLTAGGIPESVVVVFLLAFAIITPALIAGGFAERMKFLPAVLFMALWFSLVYAPMSHMVWGGAGSLMHNWGALDFAGGTAVHINAGAAALAASLVVGKRKGYPSQSMPPHNLAMCVIGGAFVWVGWFGFNAGSAVAANGVAGMSLLNTHLAGCTGILGWILMEYLRNGRISTLGLISGGLAGLVGITPACAYVGAMGALVIGFVAGMVCFFSVSVMKRRLGYDDTLDVFGLHGMGGIVGALLTGVFCIPELGGSVDLGDRSVIGQVLAQFASIVFTLVYCFVISWIILKVLDKTIGLRVDAEAESVGLDVSELNERAYTA